MLGHQASNITLDQIRQAVTVGETAKMHRNSPHPDCPVGKGVRHVLGTVYQRADEALDRELAQISVESILSEVLREEVLQSG